MATAETILGDYFEAASKRLRAIVISPPGRTVAAREFRQAQAAQQIARVDETLVLLNRQSAVWAGKHLTASYIEGQAIAARQIAAAGVVKPVPRPDARAAGIFAADSAAKSIASDTAGDLRRAADSMGNRAKRVLRRVAAEGLSEADINAILVKGVIDGDPTDYRELRDALRAVHGARVVITDKNGDERSFDTRHYAEMVARTRTREAVEAAKAESYAEAGIDLVTITGRISQYFCTAYVGKVFSLSGNDSEYPPLSSLPGGGPPFHPNCSKSTAPFIRELATSAQVKAAKVDADTRAMVTGDASEAQRRFRDLQQRPAAAQREEQIAASLQ